MTDKLQKLTDQIYQEGVERAKKEAERIIQSAHEEKKSILRAAIDEAEETKELARKEAQDLRANAESEVRMASNQALALTRQKIAELIVAKVASDCSKEVFKDPDFLKKAILTVVQAWGPSQKGLQDIYVRLPEKDRGELENYLACQVQAQLKQGMKIVFDEHIRSGFSINASDDSFRIGFTDEDFEVLIKYFLRSRMKEFLFGEK
ncbi:MAG: hypothetical protein ABIC68_05695 [Candidatus Omnitrophota bacterium]